MCDVLCTGMMAIPDAMADDAKNSIRKRQQKLEDLYRERASERLFADEKKNSEKKPLLEVKSLDSAAGMLSEPKKKVPAQELITAHTHDDGNTAAKAIEIEDEAVPRESLIPIGGLLGADSYGMMGMNSVRQGAVEEVEAVNELHGGAIDRSNTGV